MHKDSVMSEAGHKSSKNQLVLDINLPAFSEVIFLIFGFGLNLLS